MSNGILYRAFALFRAKVLMQLKRNDNIHRWKIIIIYHSKFIHVKLSNLIFYDCGFDPHKITLEVIKSFCC